MKLSDARDALSRRARVSARWGYPHDLSSVNVEGRIIGYSEKPQVLIETDDGRQVWWAIELTTLEEEESRGELSDDDSTNAWDDGVLHGMTLRGESVAQAWDEGFAAGSARRPRVEVDRRNPYRDAS